VARNRNRSQFDRYRAWQWIKHLALADYIVPWARKLGSIARALFVIDLFAGAGTYSDVVTGKKIDGSPVILARQAARYTKDNPGRSIHVICTERDSKNFEALSKRLAGFGSLVTVLKGGFARHLEKILSIIGNSPALVLFDPIGLKPIPAETIRPLLHRRGKTDVFMVLHFKVIHRTAGQLLPSGHADPDIPGSMKAAESIDAVFGSPRWRFIAKNPRYDSVEARERAYLDLYFEDVLGERYSWTCAYAVRSKYIAKVQYWLVHASDHLDAHLLMNDEIVKLERGLFAETYSADAIPEIIEYENDVRIQAAEARLRERMLTAISAAPGGTMTFHAVRDALLPDFFGQVKQGAYSRNAKALIQAGSLVREQPTLRAKLEPGERLSIPPPSRADAASSAA
jgi:three-Cys-motif partner protein